MANVGGLDSNSRRALSALSSVDNTTVVNLWADPTTHRLLVDNAAGAGITSINSDATAAQVLAVGTAGTDFAIVDNGTGTHTFNLPTASATNRGALSSADWTTFNGKGSGTVTAVSVASANGFAGSSSGGSTPALTISTSINSPVLAGNGTAISAATTTGSGSTVVLSSSPTLVTPNLGTPSTLVGTNITGTGALFTAGTVTTNANLTGAITSSGNATSLGSFSSSSLAGALTDETGSGVAVFGTNPTIAKPVMNARNQTAQTYTPAGGGTATLDLSLADQHYVTFPAGNITVALSNDTNNQIFLVSLTQDSSGSRTVTWFTTIKWAGGTTPTLTTTANKRDTFGFIRTGSGTYDGFIIGQNI